jgi:hypothetical protein
MIRELHPHTRPQRTESPEQVDEAARKLGYEPQDWPVGKIARGLATLFLILGLVTAAAAPLVRRLGPDWRTSSALAAARDFKVPGPRLESRPGLDRAILDARRRQALDHAPKPIDAAMREVAARGWQEPKP